MKKGFFSFVLMPFDAAYDDTYRLGIQGAADETEIRAERLDEQLFTEGMMEQIYRQIENADCIIAELSDRNPNVFYELGYAHAKEKLCILLTKNADNIPFDLKHRQHIIYGDSLTYLKDELVKAIDWAKDEKAQRDEGRLRVEMKGPTGNLKSDERIAKAQLEFTFDIFNDSTTKPTDISAIYLYSGQEWQISQDGKNSPSTSSDVEPFKHRYFLSSPASKLEKESWAQVKFNGSRILSRAWKGEEIKFEYHLTGRGMLRFVTSEGMIDYPFRIDIEIDDIPF